jgi:hypothetical protein
MAVLKVIVDFERFLRNLRDSCGSTGLWGDPTGALAPRRLPGTPAERERISQKSTPFINTAFLIKIIAEKNNHLQS